MRIAMWVPQYSPMTEGTWVTSLLDHAWALDAGHQVHVVRAQGQPLDMVRNRAVAQALEAQCDLLYMVDADTWADHSGSPLEQLVDTLETTDAAVAGAVVPLNNGRSLNATPAEVNEVVETERIGAAMLLIDLRKLAAMDYSGPWFKTTLTGDGLSVQESEDVHFCRVVREHGGTLFANCQIPTNHAMRNFPLSIKLYLLALKERKRDVTATTGAPTATGQEVSDG